MRGHPPKVIWLAVANAGTASIAKLVLASRDRMQSFLADEVESLLVLEPRPQA